MKAVTASESLEIDRRTQEDFHIDGMLLMEQAGTKAFGLCTGLCDPEDHLLFLSGGGNNGGDALVMAREALLCGYSHISVVTVSDHPNEAVTSHIRKLNALGVPMFSLKDDVSSLVEDADVVFDGLFGVGLSGPVRPGPVRDFMVQLNNTDIPLIIAVDLPSGMYDGFLSGDPVIPADVTITFGNAKKMCYYPHSRLVCGQIMQVNPGFPPSLLDSYGDTQIISDLDGFVFPEYQPASYKNTKGHTAVFAGSPGYSGAALLCAEAALRSRSGLVTMFADEVIYDQTASRASISLMVQPCRELISSQVLDRKFQALAAGPGWGSAGREQQMRELVNSSLPLVLDADAIGVFAAVGEKPDKPVILTPHPGEFERLSGVRLSAEGSSIFEAIRSASETYQAIIVLKSYLTYICSPQGNITVIEGMNPALGTAGSGDVLTGIIAALLAQGMDAYEAAVTGVGIHQRCGELTSRQLPGLISEDLLTCLSGM
jgi:NAD(P)H-hydrate epimerase